LTASSNLKPFKPGQTGNPRGRPKGSRHKLAEAFLAAMLADFEQQGPAVIAIVRATDPAQYLKIIASLVPRQIDIPPDAFEGVSDSDLDALIEAVRAELAKAQPCHH
jgi:hypothetical protein